MSSPRLQSARAATDEFAMRARASPSRDPSVPGALEMYPIPKPVARNRANRGLRAAGGAAASGFGLIRIRFFGRRFVNDRLGNDVAFGGPVAEIQKAAALAAKREVGMLGGVRGGFADWAMVRHGCVILVPMKGQGSNLNSGLAGVHRGRCAGRARPGMQVRPPKRR